MNGAFLDSSCNNFEKIDRDSSSNVEDIFPNRFIKLDEINLNEPTSDICSHFQDDVAFVTSKNKVTVIDSNNLVKKYEYNPHKENITGLHFAPSNPYLLYTSSLDGTIQLWDSRQDSRASSFDSTTEGNAKPLTAFGVSPQNHLLAAGTELIKGDSFIIFWDVRGKNLLGGYWESHSDEITYIHFSKSKKDFLATTALDNLVNIFDLSQPDEDSSLVFSLNTQDNVHSFNLNTENNHLVCLTDVHSIQLWDIQETAPKRTFTREDITKTMHRCVNYECYTVPINYSRTFTNPILLTGSGLEHTKSSCLRALSLNMDTGNLEPYGLFVNEPISEKTQCGVYFEESSRFVTVTENGTVYAWQKGSGKKKAFKSNTKICKKNKKPY